MTRALEYHLQSRLLVILGIEDMSLGLFHEYTKSAHLQEKKISLNNMKLLKMS